MSFIEEIIEDIKKAKELNEEDKRELVKLAQEAWDGEQEELLSDLVRNSRPCGQPN